MLPNIDATGGNKPRRGRQKKAGDGKKRRLNDEQSEYLESSFGRERKLECRRKETLAMELGIDPKQVAVWFQNRRARWKSRQLEEKYHTLKSDHEGLLVEKCLLENEVQKLKERLSITEEEIKRLSIGINSTENHVKELEGSFLSTVNYIAVAEENYAENCHEEYFFKHDFMYSSYLMGWGDDLFGCY